MEIVEKRPVSPLVEEWDVRIGPEDYKNSYDEQIKRLKERIHLKGFRPGKIPKRAIEERYGKTVLREIIQEQMEIWLEESNKNHIPPYYVSKKVPITLPKIVLAQKQKGFPFKVQVLTYQNVDKIVERIKKVKVYKITDVASRCDFWKFYLQQGKWLLSKQQPCDTGENAQWVRIKFEKEEVAIHNLFIYLPLFPRLQEKLKDKKKGDKVSIEVSDFQQLYFQRSLRERYKTWEQFLKQLPAAVTIDTFAKAEDTISELQLLQDSLLPEIYLGYEEEKLQDEPIEVLLEKGLKQLYDAIRYIEVYRQVYQQLNDPELTPVDREFVIHFIAYDWYRRSEKVASLEAEKKEIKAHLEAFAPALKDYEEAIRKEAIRRLLGTLTKDVRKEIEESIADQAPIRSEYIALELVPYYHWHRLKEEERYRELYAFHVSELFSRFMSMFILGKALAKQFELPEQPMTTVEFEENVYFRHYFMNLNELLKP